MDDDQHRKGVVGRECRKKRREGLHRARRGSDHDRFDWELPSRWPPLVDFLVPVEFDKGLRMV